MMPALLSLVLLLLLAGTIIRARSAALRLRDETSDRLPVGRDGIVVGAEAIDMQVPGSSRALLLLHGGGDTPQTLRYLAEYMYARGYNVRAPLLPGHGRSVSDFAAVTASSWMEAAQAVHRELSARYSWVGIVGLSMGGALAVRLAAEDDTIPALALLAPYLAMPRYVALAARLAAIWGFAVPYVRSVSPTAARSILDPSELKRSLAYGVFTPAALRALRSTVRKAFLALPRVTVPTLMIQSREDNRIAPRDAQRAFDRVGSRDKQLVWIAGAGHVITVDYGRDRVFATLADWLELHRGAERRERPA